MKAKVLVIDDKDEFRTLVRIYLSTNFEVETANSGLEALKLLHNGYRPNLIVSDLNMPVVDGKSLVNQVKSSGLFNEIPIIILSSIDKSSEKIELIKAGVNDYLVKPFNPEELKARIERILSMAA